MHYKSTVVLAAVVCLFTASAFAGITRLAPTEIEYATEDFINVYGTGLVGQVRTEVVFDGIYTVEPNFAGDDRLLAFVPTGVVMVPGPHSLVVRSIDDGGGVRTHGPAVFTVKGLPTGGPPLLDVPETVVAEAESARGANVTFAASAVNPNGDSVAVTCTHQSGALFRMGTTNVGCTASNADGTSSRGFTVFVTDTVAPELTLPGDISTTDPAVTFTATAVDAIDGPLAVTCSPGSGSTFTQGATRVRCFAVDAHQNRADGAFFVRVAGAGSIEVPDDLEAEATSAAGAAVTFTASDGSGNAATCAPASGSTFPLGDTLVTCTAGTATATFRVTVTDHTAPVLTLPSLVEAEATSPSGATVSWVATANDLVSGDVAVECVPLSGGVFPLGTTIVICQAVDAAGNSAGSSFDVTVADSTPPGIINVAATPNILWPPNHKMIDVTVTATAIDAVDPAPSVRILSVKSNQPVNGTGDGDVGPDWNITGPMTVQLRAERAQNKERVYTITLQSTDASGNVGVAALMVRVTEPPKRRSVRP